MGFIKNYKEEIDQETYEFLTERGFQNISGFYAAKFYRTENAGTVELIIDQKTFTNEFHVSINWSCCGAVDPAAALEMAKVLNDAVCESVYVSNIMRVKGYNVVVED